MKKFAVVTPTGCIVFESDSKVQCNRYLRNALCMGSPVGFLEVVRL